MNEFNIGNPADKKINTSKFIKNDITKIGKNVIYSFKTQDIEYVDLEIVNVYSWLKRKYLLSSFFIKVLNEIQKKYGEGIIVVNCSSNSVRSILVAKDTDGDFYYILQDTEE